MLQPALIIKSFISLNFYLRFVAFGHIFCALITYEFIVAVSYWKKVFLVFWCDFKIKVALTVDYSVDFIGESID